MIDLFLTCDDCGLQRTIPVDHTADNILGQLVNKHGWGFRAHPQGKMWRVQVFCPACVRKRALEAS